jgi:hypothetical protein
VFFEESVDGGLKIDDRSEDAALEATLGQYREEALGGVEPRGRCRRERKAQRR